MKPYDPHFLGEDFPVALPDYRAYTGYIATNKETGDSVLDYTYYSVVQNRMRRVPLFSASNIFRTGFEQLHREGDFRPDDRIEENEQLTSKDYKSFNTLKQRAIDKGHMTKREDVQWDANGDTDKAQEAAENTFYYTNAAPQHKKLNIGLWKQLENAIIIKGRVRKPAKVCVFTGPVLQNDDPEYNAPLGDGTKFQIPVLFWKVVYYVFDGELYRAGFLMGQTNLLLKDELITIKTALAADTLKPFLEFRDDEKYQVDVTFIEERTRMRFAPATDRHEGKEPALLKEVEVQTMGVDGLSYTTYSIEGLNV